MGYRSRISAIALLTLAVILFAGPVSVVRAATDTTGAGSSISGTDAGYVEAVPITISASGSVQTIGVNWAGTTAGSVRVALYSAGVNKPGSLLTQSADTAMTGSTGWQDISVTSYSVTAGSFWLAIQLTAPRQAYWASGTRSYYSKSYGAFDAAWSSSSASDSYFQWNMRITYSTGPPPSDFTITATTTSQTVGAGATASYTLQITYSGSLSATVNLAVTSGCPAGVTCMLSPSSVTGSGPVTLSVPTLVTTPGGTTTVTVTATSTSPALSHSVSVQLTVNSPGSYGVNVHAGATQVVVTVSWAGSGTAAVTLAGPGGSPTVSESGAIVYDRLTYVSGSSSPNNIHRVTFTITAPPSAQAWTVLVSLSGSYTVTIEVS